MALQFACETFATADDVLNVPDGCPFETGDDIVPFLEAASDVIFQLTGGRVHGRCTVTVYPMTDDTTCLNFDGIPRSHWWNDGWLGATIFHGPQIEDHFNGRVPVRLAGPSPTIVRINIDGVDLVDDWIIVNGEFLIRRSGSWPRMNNITQASGVGTWFIEYTYGAAPDLLLRDACVELAIDIAKSSGIGVKRGFGPGVIAANIQGAQVTLDELTAALGSASQQIPALERFLGIYKMGVGPDVYTPEMYPYRLEQVTFST